jgi:hypothetical protein
VVAIAVKMPGPARWQRPVSLFISSFSGGVFVFSYVKMLQSRFNAIWIFVVSFLGLSALLLLAAERFPVTGNRSGRISKKQVAAAKGDVYLLGVGKADITGFVATGYRWSNQD